MSRVCIVANENDQARKLKAELAQRGLDCLIAPYNDGVLHKLLENSPGIMLLDVDESTVGSEAREVAQRIIQERQIPLIALVPREKLDSFDFNIGVDDFVVKPCEANEVIARIRRILRQKEDMSGEGNIIKHGDLVIDSTKCEVSIAGKPVVLTFKEYRLLKFLANNTGKVFSREALLNKVWGWDYYGGDRTVDVHIRRLRSKIEDRNHSFIETVRNIGYKFVEDENGKEEQGVPV